MKLELPAIDDVSAIAVGDMPGDKVHITESHLRGAEALLPRLGDLLEPLLADGGRAVIAVHGGSGVGKSETGALIAHALKAAGIGAYILSGDNYPHRIPAANDAERLRTFRNAGVRALARAHLYTDAVRDELTALQASGSDAAGATGAGGATRHDLTSTPRQDTESVSEDGVSAGAPAWLDTYQDAGRRALAAYLGSPAEIDFDEVNRIIAAFKAGESPIALKRMGRTEGELWYERLPFDGVRVLVVEWTHGNNEHVQGVDIPVLLASTPEETLAHRRARARDGAVDSPFTSLVLALEQDKLTAQSSSAAIIVAKSGDLIGHATYLARMGTAPAAAGAPAPTPAAASGAGGSEPSTPAPASTPAPTAAAASEPDAATAGPDAGPMLNVYPDSLAGTLAGTVDFLSRPEVADAFTSAYLLPSVFDSDLDRGFSVISYDLNDLLAKQADLDALRAAGVTLKFDFILNHASVLSPQFQDLLANGDASAFRDFFLDWNEFWAGHGQLTEGGWIEPDPDVIEDMVFRKPGLPILMVRFPDGSERPYWNTFYQEVRYPVLDAQAIMRATGLQYASADLVATRVNEAIAAGRRPADADLGPLAAHRDAVVSFVESQRTYLGQMDLNVKSPAVWDFYADTLARLAAYGATIVRLDAFAYAPKEPGAKNFLNEPGTWDLLAQVRELADRHGVWLLPEIHSRYAEGVHEVLADQGYLTYDFFLPGLVIHALDRADGTVLRRWIGEVIERGIRTVTMLGCHDGIPVLDLQGLLPDEEIDAVIATLKSRGGYVKDLQGPKKVYYQVNATYFSALGADEASLLLARAIQLFVPGKPQVWYLDLFAGENNLAAVERAGSGGHKEINRTNLSADDIEAGLARPVVADQLELLRFRATCPAFGFDATCTVGDTRPDRLSLTWTREGHTAVLDADLAAKRFTVTATDAEGAETFRFER